MPELKLDVAIFGGGIAGLWTLLRLRQQGYSAILFEAGQLGGGQSVASQGILHSGIKYALTGKQTKASEVIAAMPAIWQSCLAGKGDVDLTDVRVLSENQLLWSTDSLSSKLSGFFARKLMRSRIQAVPSDDFPRPFDDDAFNGDLYRLYEPVLDTVSLLGNLAKQANDYCWRLSLQDLRVENSETLGFSILSNQQQVKIRAHQLILTAGEGNAELLAAFGRQQPQMQTRPLHMVLMKGVLPEVFAHCLGPSSNPKVTITSYPLNDRESLWYLGGQLAETGVQRTEQEQISASKKFMQSLLPWLDFNNISWSAFRINRAEPAMPGGKRPDDCYVHDDNKLLTAWPTKLVFAPRLADKVISHLEKPLIGQQNENFQSLAHLNHPDIAGHPAVGVRQWS